MFSTSDSSLLGTSGTAPLLPTEEKKFGCSDMGKLSPLFVIVAALVSDSTGFSAVPGTVVVADKGFSSNVVAKDNAGPDPLFIP